MEARSAKGHVYRPKFGSVIATVQYLIKDSVAFLYFSYCNKKKKKSCTRFKAGQLFATKIKPMNTLLAQCLFYQQTEISGWKWLSTNGPQATWQSLRGSAEKDGRKSLNPRVQSLSRHNRKDSRLRSLPKGASTKYWVKGPNAYVRVTFHVFMFWLCRFREQRGVWILARYLIPISSHRCTAVTYEIPLW